MTERSNAEEIQGFYYFLKQIWRIWAKGYDTNFHRAALGKYLAQHSSTNFGLRFFHKLKERVITLSVIDWDVEKATKQLVTNGEESKTK